MLARQASDYDVSGHNFHIQEQSMHKNLNSSRAGTYQSAKPIAQSSRPTPSGQLG
jgi:hypothetical protein